MANTDVGRESSARATRESERDRRDRDRDRDGDRDRSGMRLLTSTETRRAFVTTEFWLALATAVAVVVAGYWDEGNLRVSQAWALASGIIAFYVLSRGIAKAGDSEPKIREIS
jgi:hypothetical protein